MFLVYIVLLLCSQIVLYVMLFHMLNVLCTFALGHAVVQLVEALRYKPEGGGFDSRWCHWNFSLT
jgi:hypothetical protein